MELETRKRKKESMRSAEECNAEGKIGDQGGRERAQRCARDR